MAFFPLCKGVQVRFSNFTVYSLCRGERTWLRDTCSDNCYTVYKLVQLYGQSYNEHDGWTRFATKLKLSGSQNGLLLHT